MMLKLSNKIANLNFEQKLLFLATLVIPVFIFTGIVALGLKEIYKAIYDFIYPPGIAIDFSVCGFGFEPWFLAGYVIICGLTILISTFCVLHKRFFASTIFLFATISIISFRAFYVYNWISETFNNPQKDIFFSYLIEDLIFVIPVILLTIWQIPILLRGQNKIGLK